MLRIIFTAVPKTLPRVLLAAFLLTLWSASNAQAQTTSATDGTTPAGIAPGAPAGSYQLSGFDNINLYSGNLNFQMPLLGIKGRGAAGTASMLKIDAEHWRIEKGNVDGTTTYDVTPNTWEGIRPGYGPGVLQGRRSCNIMVHTNRCGATLTRLTFTASDGTEYELRDQLYGGQIRGAGVSRGTIFISADGNAATFVSDAAISDPSMLSDLIYPSGYLTMADGTRYRIDFGTVTWLRDRNGNRVTFDYDAYSRVTTITDTLNRQVTISYANLTTVMYDQINFTGFGGTPRTIKVWHSSLSQALRSGSVQTYSALFGGGFGGGSQTYNPNDVVSAVELPDGRQYHLFYNSYGELARVELPTGGAIEYDYSPDAGLFTYLDDYNINRRVTERRVYANGTTLESKQVYSAVFSAPGDAKPWSSTVTVEHRAADNTLKAEDKHYFYGSPVAAMFEYSNATKYQAWKEGREYQSEALDTNGTTVLRRTANTWQQRAPVSWWTGSADESPANDPRISETVSTLEPTVANLVARQIITYDDSVPFNNQADEYDYDYGVGAAGPLLRRTHTDYLTSANYTDAINNAGLRRLPTQKWVSSDAAGSTKSALTTFSYDQSALTDRPGIIGLDGAFTTGYTTRGNVTSVTKYADAGGGTGALTGTMSYDIAGNVVSTTDARGKTSTVDYTDSFSDGINRNTFALAKSATSPVPDPTGTYGSTTALVTSSVYDFSTGLLTSTNDANNQTTTLSYADDQGALDPLDRLRKVSRPDGGWTKYDYNRNTSGDYVHTQTKQNAAGVVEDAYGFFDGLGRPYRSFKYENYDTTKPWLTTDTAYDALGRAWKASLPYRSTGSDAAMFAGGKWTESVYDALGRVTTVTSKPDNAVVSTAYSGNSVTVTDQAGKSRRSYTDALGRLDGVVEDPFGAPLSTNYKYDALGNLRQVQQDGQQNGQTILQRRYFMYDSLSRLIRAKNPEQDNLTTDTDFPAKTDATSGTSNSDWSVAYAYDADGNLVKRKDARNVTTSYSYDALNRNTLVSYSDSTPGIKRIYDSAVNGRGRFRANWSWNGTDTYYTHQAVDNYDAAGRPLDSRQYIYTNNVAGTAFATQRTYDLEGHVTSQTYPSGRVVTYAYDVAGRTNSFAGTLGDGTQRTYSSGVIYDETGGMKQEQFGTTTPVYNKHFYNSRAQLNEIRVSTYSVLTAGQETNWNRGAILNTYGEHPSDGWTESGYDNNGNLSKQQIYIPTDDAISNYSQSTFFYNYDSLNRVFQAREAINNANAWVQYFDYDRWGNRTINQTNTWGAGINNKSFSVDANTNRLLSPNSQLGVMNYDAAGNLSNDSYTTYGSSTGAQTRFYDAENRMTTAKDGNLNVVSSYTYDADGHRVKRTVAGQPEVWQVYGMDGELLAEYAASAAPASPQKEYGYRSGELLITADATAATTPTLANSGFESPALGGGNFQYSPTGGTWSFVAGAGVSGNSSGFTGGNPGAPEGAQIAFIQGGSAYISQAISGLQVGATYRVRFSAAQRGNGNQGGQDFQVLIDTASLGTFRPASTSYAETVTSNFTATAATQTLKFLGVNSSGGDNTAFIDNVRLELVAPSGQGTQSFVTGKTLGALRGDYTGHVGMRVTIGAQDITVTSLGRIYVSGNTGTHTLKVVRASDNALVASVNLMMAGGTSNQFKYAILLSPVTLSANTDYYVVSTETNGGDIWYDYYNTVLTTTAAASVKWGLYGDGVNWGPAGGTGNCYVPVDFQYQTSGSGGGSAANIQWLISDQLGTPRMVIDNSGSLSGVKRHDYLPFGEELGVGVGGRTTAQGYVADNLRQRWSKLERDGETGLDYAQNRYYSPMMGRFTSPDEPFADQYARDPQSWNLYTYTRNNPLRYNDPTGRGIGDFFEKLKNKLVYGVWGDEKAVQAAENKRRADLMSAANSDGSLLIQNYSGEWVRIQPAQLNRAQVWAWSILLYTYQDEPNGGRRDLSPVEMAGVINDANQIGRAVNTSSESRSNAFQEAKTANDIPTSKNPDRVIKPGTSEGDAAGLRPGENTRMYEYTNNQGKKIWIREDSPVQYPDGGSQGPHFNSGPAGEKLVNHHYWKP